MQVVSHDLLMDVGKGPSIAVIATGRLKPEITWNMGPSRTSRMMNGQLASFSSRFYFLYMQLFSTH